MHRWKWKYLGLALGLGLLAGCDDAQKLTESMRLSAEQSQQAKPILVQYLQNQENILKEFENQMKPSEPGGMGQGGFGQQPPSGFGQQGQQGQQGGSDMRAAMDKKKQEVENRCLENDKAAATELSAFLSADQVEAFKKAALEYRQQKIKEKTESRRGGPGGGGHGGPGGGGFGGGPGGGMGGGMGGF